jgi:hypothetical protein
MANYKFADSGDTTQHSFDASDAAAVAATLVSEDFFLSALISRNYENDLLGGGKRNRTVDVKVPGALMAQVRAIGDKTTGITLSEIEESRVQVTLGEHVLNAVSLDEEELNYTIKDFGAQVLKPQAEAVSDYIEHTVAEKILAEAVADSPVAYDPANPVPYFTAIRKVLRDLGLPMANLNVIVGTEVYANLLDAKAFTDASESGSTAALREGSVGKVRGLTVVESLRVPETQVFAFHRDAFTMAVRSPKVPAGVPFGSQITEGGFPLRWTREYDTTHQADLSVVSTFAGVAKMPLFKVERDYTAGTAKVVQVPGGAIRRFDTTDAPGTV